MTPRDKDALERLIECVQAIDVYVSRVGADWPTDDMAVDAIAKRIEEIGEVARRLTPETLAAMPEINWRAVKGIREVIALDYDTIDVDLLANIVRDNLPELYAATDEALAAADRSG